MKVIDVYSVEFRELLAHVANNTQHLSYSSSKNLLGSNWAYKFFAYKLHAKQETPALALGQLYDTILLDYDNRDSLITRVADDLNGNCKQFKELKALAESENKVLVREADYEHAEFIRGTLLAGVNRSPIIQAVFDTENCIQKAKFEKPLQFEDPKTKSVFTIPFKGEADVFCPNGDFVVDIKSTSRSNFYRYKYQFDELHYDLQGAIYRQAFGVDKFYHLLVDINTGDCRIYRIGATRNAIGDTKLEEVVQCYKSLQESLNTWIVTEKDYAEFFAYMQDFSEYTL